MLRSSLQFTYSHSILLSLSPRGSPPNIIHGFLVPPDCALWVRQHIVILISQLPMANHPINSWHLHGISSSVVPPRLHRPQATPNTSGPKRSHGLPRFRQGKFGSCFFSKMSSMRLNITSRWWVSRHRLHHRSVQVPAYTIIPT